MELTRETKERLSLLQESTLERFDYSDVKYSIIETKFSQQTNNLKITFKKTERYQTIVRYVQKDYQRYPVYSDWKYKSTKIQKTLKIDNQALEMIETYFEYLIRDFRFQILIELNREDWVPSWAWKSIYDFEERNKCKPHQELLANAYRKISCFKESKEKEIDCLKNEIKFFEKKLIRPTKKNNKITAKLEKTKFNFKIKSLTKKLNKLEDKISSLNDSIKLLNDKIYLINDEIKTQEKEQNKEIYRIKKKIHDIQTFYNSKRKEIKKLQASIINNSTETDFIPISNISSFVKQQFAGVYIIKNNENNKCYVGQSKNVLKRLKQHFKGSVPHNVIFAEDYYSSNNRDNLFSVKIIPLQTKDELDTAERKLIEEYDSFENGYNQTGGNT